MNKWKNWFAIGGIAVQCRKNELFIEWYWDQLVIDKKKHSNPYLTFEIRINSRLTKHLPTETKIESVRKNIAKCSWLLGKEFGGEGAKVHSRSTIKT